MKSLSNEVAILEFGPNEFGVKHFHFFDIQEYSHEEIQSLKSLCEIASDLPTALHIAEDIERRVPIIEFGITKYKVGVK